MPPELRRVIRLSHQTLVALHDELIPSTYVTDDRTSLSLPLLRHTHVLAYSIGFLLQHELVAPAFALFRPLFEGYARAIWALHCADKEDLAKAHNDEFPGLYKVVNALQNQQLDSTELFVEIYYSKKESLHSYTHGGMKLIKLLYDDDTKKVEPDYPVDEQIKLMVTVQEITLGAADELRTHLKVGTN